MSKKLQLFIFCIIFAGSSVSVVTAQTPKSISQQAEYEANAKQRKELMRDYGLTESQARKIQQFSWERSQKIDALNKLDLSNQELEVKRNQVTEEHDQKVASILSPGQRAKFNPAIYRAIKSDDVKHLSLSREQAYKMGEIKAAYDAQALAMNNQKLPGRERKSQKEMLNKEYHTKLKALLGEEKFAKWLNFKDLTLERNYKAKYGFTTKQFDKYKAIENKMAVNILTIKKSAIPIDEKSEKILALKEKKIESMRSLLSPTQFEKWHKDYLKAEQRKKKH